MPDAAAWLLDTNILLRMSKSDDPHHPMIRRALRALVAQGTRLCCTSQILGEFWNEEARGANTYRTVGAVHPLRRALV
jgi:predicted nucleic acid-binding protein